MIRMDDWKQIENFPYSVNKLGQVKNDRTGKTIKAVEVTGGYLQIRLWVNQKSYNRLLHRVVASAFISNPYNKPEVNHIDGNKLNNCADNLEWVTRSENQRHRYNILQHRGHNPSTKEANESCMKKVICIETGKEFKSITAAAVAYGGKQPELSKHLLGEKENYKGMHWRYV